MLPGPPERDALAALAIRDGALAGKVSLLVPSLWQYEVGNTLARRFPAKASNLLDLLVAFDLEEMPLNSRWRRTALELTRRHGVTFYDASYHAVALLAECEFVTADARYIQRAGKSGNLRLLAHWAR